MSNIKNQALVVTDLKDLLKDYTIEEVAYLLSQCFNDTDIKDLSDELKRLYLIIINS